MSAPTIKDRLKNVLPPLRDAQWYAERAIRFLKAGDLKSATRTIEKAEPRFGDEACLRLVSAKVNSIQGADQAVRADLLRITEDPEASFESRLAACELYQSIKDDDSALRLLDELGKQYPKRTRGVVAYNTALHIYQRRGEISNALNAGINAAVAGGTPIWSTINKLIMSADLKTIETCRIRMRELESEGGSNCYYYKLMSLFDSRADDQQAMLKHMTLGAQRSFQAENPDIPWVDDAQPLTPSFLILGGMKCGSTSLYDQINRHPLCLTPMGKELQFFQHPELPDQWYLQHFPRVSPFPGFFTGEGSPGYFKFDIVDRVKNLLPEVKLLLIKRDPVDRAISHFRHNTRWGMMSGSIEKVLSGIDKLQAALLAAPDRVEEILLRGMDGVPRANAFLLLGCYEILMRRWYAAFPRERILELELEDYHASPQETMDQVFTFLGVESVDVTVHQSNKGDYVKTDAKTQRVMQRLREFYDVVDTFA